MNELANSVQWLWAFSVLAQLVLLSILVTKGHYRKLPLLTLYVALNICQAAFLYFVYVRLGYQSVYVRKVAWMSQAATLLTQAFATTEILRLVLRPYRGIWGLAWRMLVAISSVAIVYISAAAKGDWNWALVELDRGYHLMFAIAVISCLLLMRYYSVPLFPSYKAILLGFCFFSCTMILVNTILQTIWYRQFAQYGPVWQLVTIGSFAIVQIVWVVALRKPLPATAVQPTLLPSFVYEQLSPEINLGSQRLDKQLGKLWGAEAQGR